MQQIQDCLSAFNGKVNMVVYHFDTFIVTWGKPIRRLLNLPITTHCNLLPYIYIPYNYIRALSRLLMAY